MISTKRVHIYVYTYPCVTHNSYWRVYTILTRLTPLADVVAVQLSQNVALSILFQMMLSTAQAWRPFSNGEASHNGEFRIPGL